MELLNKLREIRLPLWVSLVLLVLLIVVFAWGQVGAGAAERLLATERQQLAQQVEAERAAVRREAQEALARQGENAQRLFGTALAWAVRSAMLRNNLDEVDQYFGDLVKTGRIPLALLADAEGKVLLATDRKYLESRFSEHFPAELLQQPDVSIHPDEGNRRRLVLPIQGLTSRLGTVLLVYAPPA